MKRSRSTPRMRTTTPDSVDEGSLSQNDQASNSPLQHESSLKSSATNFAFPLGGLINIPPRMQNVERSQSADESTPLSPIQKINQKYRTDATLNKDFIADFQRIRSKLRNRKYSKTPRSSRKSRHFASTQFTDAGRERLHPNQSLPFLPTLNLYDSNDSSVSPRHSSQLSDSMTYEDAHNTLESLRSRHRSQLDPTAHNSHIPHVADIRRHAQGVHSVQSLRAMRASSKSSQSDTSLLSGLDNKKDLQQKKPGVDASQSSLDLANAYINDLRDKIVSMFVDQKWMLSRFSEIFLEKDNILIYNNMVMQRLTRKEEAKIGIEVQAVQCNSKFPSVQLYFIFFFRRLLQLISLLLIMLFGVILYAMHDSGNYPTKFEDIPVSFQNTRVALNEWIDNVNFDQSFRDFAEFTFNFSKSTEDSLMPAQELLLLQQEGVVSLDTKHPIVIMPGLTSTPLELWQSYDKEDIIQCKNYMQRNLRTQIYGSPAMLREVFLYPKCFLYHMMLNETTGRDNHNIKIRPTLGINSCDYLFGAYWVWGIIIENLALIGYDSTMIHIAAYDWRIAFHDLERRDGYMTRLKNEIELLNQLHQRKVVMYAHSLGSSLSWYFLNWVQSPHGGNGGTSWVNDYIEAIVPIGGPFLGTVKAASSVLSGEAMETAIMSPPMRMMQDFFIPRPWFARWSRTILSGFWLMPIGGSIFWGNHTWAPDVDIYRTNSKNSKNSTYINDILNNIDDPAATSTPDGAGTHLGECEIGVDGSSTCDTERGGLEQKGGYYPGGTIVSFSQKSKMDILEELHPLARHFACSANLESFEKKYDDKLIKARIWHEVIGMIKKNRIGLCANSGDGTAIATNDTASKLNKMNELSQDTRCDLIDFEKLKSCDIDTFVHDYTGFDEILDTNFVYADHFVKSNNKFQVEPDGSLLNLTFGLHTDRISKLFETNLKLGNNEKVLQKHWAEMTLMESFDFDRIGCQMPTMMEELILDSIMYPIDCNNNNNNNNTQSDVTSEENGKDGSNELNEKNEEIENGGDGDGMRTFSYNNNHTLDTWSDILAMIDPKFYHMMKQYVDLTYPDPVLFDLNKVSKVEETEEVEEVRDEADENDVVGKYQKHYEENIKNNERYFHNPLWMPLWNASNLTIFCFYGTGIDTERSYIYTRDYNASMKHPFRIDTTVTDAKNNIINGVHTVEGDRTVTLLTLGYMCSRGWRHPSETSNENENENANQKRKERFSSEDKEIIGNITYKRWNPHKINIVTHEYKDTGQGLWKKGTMRGGKESGDHVDILGNELFIKHLLLIATGNGNKDFINDHFESSVNEISDNVNENLLYHYKKSKDKLNKGQFKFNTESATNVWQKWKNRMIRYFAS